MIFLRVFDVPDVLEVHVIPSDEVMMVPDEPTAKYLEESVDVSTVKEVTDSVLLAFPSESVTIIVQSE